MTNVTSTTPCDPQIESCPQDDGFKNTIELDYRTPHIIVGVISIINAILPFAFWQFRKPSSTSLAYDVFKNQGYYEWGWNWLQKSSALMWGVPSVLWLITLFVKTDIIPVLLLVWWTFMQFYISPIIYVITPIAWILGATDWNDSWSGQLSKVEVWISVLMISAVGGFSYYLFYTNFDKAFMYYDEILQEKNEEVIQFG